MLETSVKNIKKNSKKEISLDKLVSAFLDLAMDLVEKGEADEIIKNNKEPLAGPLAICCKGRKQEAGKI